MPSPNIRIGSTAVVLPDRVESAADQRSRADLDQEYLASVGVEQVHVADAGQSPPQLAVAAATAALAGSAGEIDALLHAWTYYQGHDFWSPAHYIAREAGTRPETVSGVQQMCNGGGVALELALGLLLSGRARRALLTTADVFRPPRFDRWGADSHIVYGDSGTALTLQADENPEHGCMYVRGHCEVPMPHAEALHRGDDAFAAEPFANRPSIDIRATKAAFLRHYEGSQLRSDMLAATEKAVSGALAQAGVPSDASKVAYIALPRLGLALTTQSYLPSVSWCPRVEAGLAAGTGHLGAGDLFANLHHARAVGALSAGQHGVFVSAGGGFTISATAVEAV